MDKLLKYEPLRKDLKTEIISEIDKIYCLILKQSRWQRLSNQLSDLLLKNLSESEKAAVDNALKYLHTEGGLLTEADIDEVITKLETTFKESLIKKLEEPIVKFQLKAYKGAQQELGIDFSFNKTDLRALEWLKQDQMYWITTYGENENDQQNYIREKLNRIKSDILGKELTREEAGKFLASQFRGEINRTKIYWESLADHIVTRSREFGRTEGYVKARINSLKIVAVIDHRTSKICKYMNGRIINVNEAVKQRDKLMASKDPEDVKNIAPWLSDKTADNKLKGSKTAFVVSKLKLVLPPYHWRCRTITVAAYDDEMEDYEN